MAADPVFAVTPKVGMVQISTANTARDGTGTIGTVVTGGSSGSVIKKVRVCATVTTTAGVVRLFLYDGSNTRLIQEIIVPAITPSTTVEAFSRTITYGPDDILHLPSNTWELRASTQIAEAFNVFAFYADL
jgi:hypothetical protein